MTQEHDDRPVVLVYMCSDERFDGSTGRMAELKKFYEVRGYKVYFVRVAATANWLADADESSHLLSMSQPFLLSARIVIVEAHMTCVGLRNIYAQRGLTALKDADEETVHKGHLLIGAHRVVTELRRLGNTYAAVHAQLNHMTSTAERIGIWSTSPSSDS
ncbi:MAG TPA: hypothetical protein VGH44_02890 [Candidatus Saccharimonadia bacterium]|jgi:hypothetical protein